jgi:hypothetical protein
MECERTHGGREQQETLCTVHCEAFMAAFLLWIILFILCWPLALLALVMYPFVWLLLLPFRIVGIAVDGVLGLLSALFLLPVRLLRGPRAI